MAPACFTFAAAAVLVLPGLSLGLVFNGRANQGQQGIPFTTPQTGAGMAFGLPEVPNWPAQQDSQMSWQPLSPQIPNLQSLLRAPQQLGGLQVPYLQTFLGSPQQLGSPQYAPSLVDSPQLGSPYTLGLPLQSQFGGAQTPYGQSFMGLTQEQQLGAPASFESTIMTLQAQLAKERGTELQLINAAAEKQQELSRMNQTLAHILELSEKDDDKEEQRLQEQLDNVTAVNEEQRLQEQLDNVTAVNDALQAKEKQDVQEVSMLREKVSMLQEKVQIAEDRAQHSELAKGQALRVMKDVQLAQEKVQRTEEIIHRLVPKNVLMSHRNE